MRVSIPPFKLKPISFELEEKNLNIFYFNHVTFLLKNLNVHITYRIKFMVTYGLTASCLPFCAPIALLHQLIASTE
jgi:hypothetical protein